MYFCMLLVSYPSATTCTLSVDFPTASSFPAFVSPVICAICLNPRGSSNPNPDSWTPSFLMMIAKVLARLPFSFPFTESKGKISQGSECSLRPIW
jgi:hypothetical protein